MPETAIFRTIREQIVHRLRDEVISGVFKPGANLREQTLAKRYGVSRSPIRDALLQLAQEGLLVATPNCGVKIGLRLEENLQPLIIEIRLRIEIFAINQLLDHCSDAALSVLESRLLENQRACTAGSLPDIIRTDMGFHQAIVELAGSSKLLAIWKQVTAAMMLHYDRLHGWSESHREHKQIFQAVRKRSKRDAQMALKKNIR